MTAQKTVNELISCGAADFGVYRLQPQSTISALADLRAIAQRVLSYAPPTELAEHLPQDLLAEWRGIDPERHAHAAPHRESTGKRYWSTPEHAVTTAIGVSAALEVLTSPDIHAAGEALRWLIIGTRERGLAVNPTTIGWGHSVSATLTSVQLAALHPILKPSEQLRYRTVSHSPRRPKLDQDRNVRLIRRVPTMMWPTWALRLAIPGCHERQQRMALSAALLVVGSRLTLDDAVRSLQSPLGKQGLSRVLQMWQTHPNWIDISGALIQLADYLALNHSKIDYQRRRSLDYTDLLPDATWSRICETSPGPKLSGSPHRAAVVRAFLLERISGSPAQALSTTLPTSPAFRVQVLDLPLYLTPPLMLTLRRYAAEFLNQLDIHDEPAWSSPAQFPVRDLNVPGPDPTQVDLASIHSQVHRSRTRRALTTIAENASTTIDTVRFLLETHPAPHKASAIERAGARYSREDFEDLYLRQGRSLREMAGEIGVSMGTIARLAGDYRINIRHPGRPQKAHFDRDWLYEQYVLCRRTYADIGSEAGVSATAVAAWLKKFDIKRPNIASAESPDTASAARVVCADTRLSLRETLSTAQPQPCPTASPSAPTRMPESLSARTPRSDELPSSIGFSVRTLPVRLEPLPGEALDSWLGAICHRLDIIPTDLLSQVCPGVPPAHRDYLAVGLRPVERARLSTLTNEHPDAIDALTLHRFHGRALLVDQHARTLTPKRLGSRRATRYCPHCLAVSGGRWQLRWRLNWTFACLTHQCLLTDGCATCATSRSLSPLASRYVPTLGRCPAPLAGSTVSTACCGADLASVETPRLPNDHTALTAQRWIDNLIDNATTSTGVYTGGSTLSLEVLHDIDALARRLITHVDRKDWHLFADADLVSLDQGDQNGSQSSSSLSPSALTAVGAGFAFDVLNSPDIATAAEILGRLTTHLHDRGQVRMTASDSQIRGQGRSATLGSIHLKSLASRLGPEEALRYQVTSARPRYPESDELRQLPPHRVPTVMWPEWAVRMNIPAASSTRSRLALPVLLMMIGSDRQRVASCGLLKSGLSGEAVGSYLATLRADRCWTDITMALTRLTDYLRTHRIPIDYDRRRHLDYSDVLPDRLYKQIVREYPMQFGKGRRVLILRTAVFERISGLPIERYPFARADSAFHSAYAIFGRTQTLELANFLDNAAREFLDSHGITDEPMQWAPPSSLFEGLVLPGDDPGSVDINRLLELRHDHQRSLSAIADELGTTLETVRYLLTKNPCPTDLSQIQHRARGGISATVAAALPKQQLIDMYFTEHKSVRQIALAMGVSKQTITRLAESYGIRLVGGGSKNHLTVDRDWLYEQYVVRQRILPEIAAEIGASPGALGQLIRKYGIPISWKGGAHHSIAAHFVTAHPEFRILEPALSRGGGWQRLARFAATTAYATIPAAAVALELSQASIRRRIALLEFDLNGALLERHDRAHPIILTPLGSAVLAAFEELVEALRNQYPDVFTRESIEFDARAMGRTRR